MTIQQECNHDWEWYHFKIVSNWFRRLIGLKPKTKKYYLCRKCKAKKEIYDI